MTPYSLREPGVYLVYETWCYSSIRHHVRWVWKSSLPHGLLAPTALSIIVSLYSILPAPAVSLGPSYFHESQYEVCWLQTTSLSSLHFLPSCVSTGSHFWCQHWLTFLVSANAQYHTYLSTVFLSFSSLLYHLVVYLIPFGLGFLYLWFFPVRSCSWIGAPSSYQISSFNFRLFLSELSSRNCYRTRNGYWKKSIWA